jgi:hypothetical protein
MGFQGKENAIALRDVEARRAEDQCQSGTFPAGKVFRFRAMQGISLRNFEQNICLDCSIL